MHFTLDPTRPIYLQIIEEIKRRTARGEYQAGNQLPSIRDMAQEMEVNPNTIARVYSELEREGFIVTRRGQGSFITEEQTRIENERLKLAESATERFMKEIQSLDMENGYRKKLLDILTKKFIGKK